jgi:hypothetical protein
MITIASITLISAGVAALSARYGSDSRPDFNGRRQHD